MTAFTFVPVNVFHVKQVLAGLSRDPSVAGKGVPEGVVRAWCEGPSGCVLLSGGAAVAAGGLLDEGWQNAHAWLLVSGAMPFRAWPLVINQLVEGMTAALDPATGWARRVQAETIYDWRAGHRLMIHLGMSFEGLARGMFGTNRHGAIYARVRGDVAPLPVRPAAMIDSAERCVWEDCLGRPAPWLVMGRAA